MWQRGATSTNPNLPVSRDRVEAYLKSRGWHYFIDSDGDLGGDWDGHRFYFLFYGERKEIFQVRGRWKRQLPDVAEVPATTVANAWNREWIFPKVYVRVHDGETHVFGEHAVDLEHGVADDQLGQIVVCGINTTLKAFEYVDQHFGPDPGLG